MTVPDIDINDLTVDAYRRMADMMNKRVDKLTEAEKKQALVNIMVQVTIARNAVDRYGADNFAEIQAIYGGRKYFDRRGRSHPLSCTRGCPKNVDEGERRRARRGDASILKRCRGAGIDCLKKPQLGNKLRLRNMTKEERYRAAEEIRGAPLPPFDIPKDSELKPGVEEG